MSIFESTSNSSGDQEIYIYYSTLQIIELVSDKINYSVYSIVLIFSLIQTFWKNKRIDHLLSYISDVYSDGKFKSHQICFHQQILTCYRYDQHFSHIPHPNRLMLFTIAIHIQILMNIAARTLFIRHTTLVNDCKSIQIPFEVLQCENNQNPCSSNGTETVLKCTYYSFQTNNFITMVTSVVTWHYALRYFVIKFIRFVRWILFNNNDQPRKLCCCQPTACRLRCIMYVNYIILWLYLLITVILGFVSNKSIYHIPVNTSVPAWTSTMLAVDRISTLSIALIPELLQNWLDTTVNGEVLQELKSKGLLLNNVEPLIYLISKKNQSSASTTNKLGHSNVY